MISLTVPGAPTYTPTPTASPQATRLFRPSATAISGELPWTYGIPTPFPIEPPDGYYDFDFSPNGEWVAWVTCCSDTGPYLLVERLDKTLSWEVTFDFISHNWDSGLVPLHWSIDGRYLYYGIYPSGDGVLSYVYKGIQRLDLIGGKITDELPVLSSRGIIGATFASKSERLAYIYSGTSSTLKLFVRDLLTDFDGRYSIILPEMVEYAAGDVSWSPEESNVVFLVVTRGNGRLFNLVSVNLQTTASKILIWGYGDFLYFDKWIDESHIIVYRDSVPSQVDLETGEITEVQD